MKNLYITRGNNICIDIENNTVDKLPTSRQAIDYVYSVKEPMHVIYGCGEYKKEADAEPGDIIVTFYDRVFKNQMIIVKNNEWFENVVEYEKKEQEEKERWAKSQACTNDAEPTDRN